jgi:radical SAM superfamily enzyme YgiQ (UPF0313 family)
LLELMESSGCYSFAAGIESGSDQTLKKINKVLSLKEIQNKLDLINKVTKIKVLGFFILGFPFETIQDINKTIEFALSLKLAKAHFINFSPYPGTPITEELFRNGQLSEINFEKLKMNNYTYRHPVITDRQLKKLMRKAFFKFYFRPRIFLPLLGDIRSLKHFLVIIKRMFGSLQIFNK